MVVFLALLLVKPIGVSTQFVILDGIIWNAFDSTLIEKSKTDNKTKYTSTNEYLNKSKGKYAKNIANPINYSFIFVIAMVLGAFVSSKLRGGVQNEEKSMPLVWRKEFGDNSTKRYIVTFLAGVIVHYGARLAGGCTSGHMISGTMQTAVSGYIFMAGAFIAAIPVAILLFRKEV